MVPKYRKVSYHEEGIYIFKCLMCSCNIKTYDYHDYQYCPHCGTKWEGQLECREHDVPRWVYDWEKKHGDLPYHKWHDRSPELAKRGWVIEELEEWFDAKDKTQRQWVIKYRQKYKHRNAFRAVLRQLMQYRRYSGSQGLGEHYRIRIIDFDAWILDDRGIRIIWASDDIDLEPLMSIWRQS